MTRILAIDPGSLESGWCLYDARAGVPEAWAKTDNLRLRLDLAEMVADLLVVEQVESYGMPVGVEVFETVWWSGVFVERWRSTRWHSAFRRIPRRACKLHLCGDSRAKDANIRQAIIDRYGGKEKAVGRKKSPGPLYGLTGDCWQALAVAITAAETAA